MRTTKWEQLAGEIRSEIENGSLRPGDRLPTEDQLVEQWNVCRATVHRAMQELKKEGLVVRRRRLGTVVANRSTPVQKQRSVALVLEHEQRILERCYLPAFHAAIPDELLVTYTTRGNPVVEAQLLERVTREAGGVVLFPSCDPLNDELIRRIAGEGYPLVCLDRAPEGVELDAFVTDNYGAAMEGLRYLVNRGHRRIAHFTEDRMHVPSVRERFEAYVHTMQEVGEPDPRRLVRAFQFPAHWDFLVQACYDALYTLLADSDPVTAVFCLEEGYMSAVQEALARLGVSVPEDFEILSFCDLPDWMVRDHTSVHRIAQQLRLTASLAAERVLARIRGESFPAEVTRIPAQFKPAEKVTRLTYLGKPNGPSGSQRRSVGQPETRGSVGAAGD